MSRHTPLRIAGAMQDVASTIRDVPALCGTLPVRYDTEPAELVLVLCCLGGGETL